MAAFDRGRPELSPPALSPRARKILYAVVSEYIATGEPVGSRRLAKRYGIHVSPATIRNELADLEESGCVRQPHTSAGRVPTELGFRIFIDALIQMRELSAEDRTAVMARMHELRPGIDDVVREAGRLLSSLSGAAAVLTRPRADVEKLAQIRLVNLTHGKILVLVVTRSGTVENRIVEAQREGEAIEAIDAGELERMNNLLAELVEGKSLAELRATLARSLDSESGQVKLMKERIRLLVESAAEAAETKMVDAVVIEGRGQLIERLDLSDVGKIRGLLRAFDEKQRLLTLLDRAVEAGGVRVLIGSETELAEVDDISVISAQYQRGGVRAGSVGIIGPRRMDYGKLMPLVGFTAQVIGEVLDQDESES